jgi:hypothetical protein
MAVAFVFMIQSVQQLAYEQEIRSYTATPTCTSTATLTAAAIGGVTDFPPLEEFSIRVTSWAIYTAIPNPLKLCVVCYDVIGCIPEFCTQPPPTVTDTPSPTATSTPTSTSTPTATFTNSPTVTYTYSPTFTATPAPIASPTVVGGVSAFIFILCSVLLIGIVIRIVRRRHVI